MGFGTLYSFPGDHPRTIAIKAMAKLNNLDLRIVEEPKCAEHLKVSKLGKVPAFLGEDGLELFECLAIVIYITSQDKKTSYFGKTTQDYANILKWMSFFNSEILDPIVEQYLPLVGVRPYNKESIDLNEKMAHAAVDVVEEHMSGKIYLVGEEITLADVFCAGVISFGFRFFYGKSWRQAHPNVTRWFEHIIDQPVYSDVTEKLEFLDEPKLVNVVPEKAEENGSA